MQLVFKFSLIGLFALVLAACTETQKEKSFVLSNNALKGKFIFEQKNCGKCHTLGDKGKPGKAPDLSRPILANDSLFVQTHLKFVKETNMPPIELTPEEIRLVSYYIAEIHAATHRMVDEENADTYCPVCYAPVNSEIARKSKLLLTYLGNTYYFECKECMNTFKEAPEAFLILWKEWQAEKSFEIKSEGSKVLKQ